MKMTSKYCLQFVFSIALFFGAIQPSYGIDIEGVGVEKVVEKSAVGRKVVKAWESVEHLGDVVRLNSTILGKIDAIRNSGNIPVEKFDLALKQQFGQILDSANEIDANKILDRLQEAHVNDKHFDEVIHRLQKYPTKVAQELITYPDQFEFFDEVLRHPENYRELAQIGTIPSSSPLYKWALGKFRKQILDNAEILETAVSANIDDYIEIPEGYIKATQVTLKGTKKTRPDDFIYNTVSEIDPDTGIPYNRAILHDTKLHQDVNWTTNQYNEIIKKFEDGASFIDLELRTMIDEANGLIPGRIIRIYKTDVYKSIGTLDKSGTYLSTSKVF